MLFFTHVIAISIYSLELVTALLSFVSAILEKNLKLKLGSKIFDTNRIWYFKSIPCAVDNEAFYPSKSYHSLAFIRFVCFLRKIVSFFRSLPQYRLSSDLQNSNVDCQFKSSRTVDCF
jgi:hypothetical protein